MLEMELCYLLSFGARYKTLKTDVPRVKCAKSSCMHASPHFGTDLTFHTNMQLNIRIPNHEKGPLRGLFSITFLLTTVQGNG
jgi:hypothetical protein